MWLSQKTEFIIILVFYDSKCKTHENYDEGILLICTGCASRIGLENAYRKNILKNYKFIENFEHKINFISDPFNRAHT